MNTASSFLPICMSDLNKRGLKELDIVLITGDAYVDHPSYGVAVIGRVLEDAGFNVGIIAQPDWKGLDDFKGLGRPKLFFGITAGNLDSMVANYTANKRPRKKDDYSPGGKTGLRPDRATIVYSNRAREAYPGVPIILGGIEASLRRLAHYDYWDNVVRRSILLDAKADMLVYGMGERQVLEIARRLNSREDIDELDNIRGTVVVRNKMDSRFSARGGRGNDRGDYIIIPSFEEVKEDKDKFNQAFREFYLELDPHRGRTVVQKSGARFIIQFPPASPLSTKEMDKVYLLNYARRCHPVYNTRGVPGFETVSNSIISHRGCCGECNFCALYFHQGRIIQSRSEDSILREIEIIAGQKDFRGTITDIGGPTANLYMAACKLWGRLGACKDKNCLMPSRCKGLELGYKKTLGLWEKARRISGVRHVFIGSGLRYDLLTDRYAEEYLAVLYKFHVSGQLKVAPEHICDSILKLMNKPNFKAYRDFEKRFYEVNKGLGKKQYLVNYFISAHPGAGLNEALELALELLKKNIHPEQVQDFIPLPLTTSGAMYYTEKDPFTGDKVYVAKSFKERKMQRALIQHKNPNNKKLVLEALKILGKYEKRRLFFKAQGR